MASKELHCGWLTKRGGVRRNWKQRWFVVYANKQMKYFETGKRDKCLGTIDLTQVLSIAPCDEKGVRAHSIALTTQDRVWVLATESSESVEKWLHMLEVCVGTAKRLVTTKEGFLMKKGKLNKNWKTRYFALGKGWLFYFAQEEDCAKFKRIAFFSEKVFRLAFFKYVSGSIPLEQAVIERWGDSRTRITVSTPQRVYHIIAKSERELDGWIQAIHKSVGKFKAQKHPPRESQEELPLEIQQDEEDGEDVESGSPRATQEELDEMAEEMNRRESLAEPETEDSVELAEEKADDHQSNGSNFKKDVSLRHSKVEFESDDSGSDRDVPTYTTPPVAEYDDGDDSDGSVDADGPQDEDGAESDGLPEFPSLRQDNTSDFKILHDEVERERRDTELRDSWSGSRNGSRQSMEKERRDSPSASDDERQLQEDKDNHRRTKSLLEEITEEKEKHHRKVEEESADAYYTKARSGILMQKHGRKGHPHERTITVDRDLQVIRWGSGADQQIQFQDITAVSAGKTTEVFARSAQNVADDLCFSLVTPSRTLDLQAESKKGRDNFVSMLRTMLTMM